MRSLTDRVFSTFALEGQHVDGPIHEAAFYQRGQLPPHLGRQHRLIERAERVMPVNVAGQSAN